MKLQHILHALPVLAALLGIAAMTPAVSSAEEPDPALALIPTIPPVESKIRIDTMPDKLLYRVGETFDLTGVTVTTAYGSGGEWEPEVSFQEITLENGFSVQTPDLSVPGIRTVTITFIPERISAYQQCITSTASFEITVTDLGDLDVNGALSTDDLRLMNRVLHGKESLSGTAAENADMNADGEIDAFDLALMKRSMHEKVAEYMTLTPDIRLDLTKEASAGAWNTAYQKNDKNTIAADSQRAMLRFCTDLKSGVLRALQKRYSEEFFEKNVLLLHYGIYDGSAEREDVADIAYKDGTLTVTTKPLEISKPTCTTSLMLWQIVLPKEQYNGAGVVWEEQDAVYFDADYSLVYLDAPVRSSAMETISAGVLVTTPEEAEALDALLFEPQDRHETLPGYPGTPETVSFCRLVEQIDGEKAVLHQARRIGDRLIADVRDDYGFGDVATYFLEILTVPAEYAADGPEIVIRKSQGGAYFATDGKVSIFEGNEQPALAVCQYDFGGEYETAFYWVYPEGFVPFGRYKLISTEAVSADASQFHECYVMNGQPCKDDAEGFSVEWGETGVTVNFMRSKANKQTTLLHFPYPKS